VTFRRPLGQSQNLGRLLHAHAREIAQVHDLGFERVFLFKVRKCFVNGQYVFRARFVCGQGVLQLDALAVTAAFRSCLGAGLLHQDIAHGPGRDKEEMPLALQVQITFAQQPQIRFVDQCGRLHGLARRQMRHAGLGQLAQLAVNEGQEPGRRIRVALLGRPEYGCHLVSR